MSKEFELPGRKGGKLRDVKLPTGGTASGGSARKHRTAALANVPQAVAKLTSYSKGSHNAVARHISYVSRQGKLEIETSDGTVLPGKDAAKIVREWGEKHLGKVEDAEMKNGNQVRKTANFVLSSPAGTDPEKVRDIARDFLNRQLGDKSPYAFTLHTDTKNHHVHVVVPMVGYDGKKLRFNKPELTEFRKKFAEVATEHGVALTATKRFEHGKDQGDKTTRSNVDYRMAERGEITRDFGSRMRDAINELSGKEVQPRRADTAFQAAAERDKNAHREDAAFYRDQDKSMLARIHAEQSATPRPLTVREQFRELVASVANGKDHPLDRKPETGPSAGMRVLAEAIAKEKNLALPDGLLGDFAATRAFLDQHARRQIGGIRGQSAERELD